MRNMHWTTCWALLIVSLLFIHLPSSDGGDGLDDAAAKLAEAELQLQVLTEQNLQLQATLARRERELETIRADHARAILDQQKLRDELAALKLKAANLLVNADDLTASREMLQVLRDLHVIGDLHQRLKLQVTDYKRTVDATLDVDGVTGDAPVRHLLQAKVEDMLRTLQQANQLTTPADRPRSEQLRLTCQVMAVNTELGVVVLDAGRDHGTYPGALWKVISDGQTITVQVIEARPTLSAAIVTVGQLADVTPGATARRNADAAASPDATPRPPTLTPPPLGPTPSDAQPETPPPAAHPASEADATEQ